jgi:3-oxoacyl-[acyl-carrier protein] reductase
VTADSLRGRTALVTGGSRGIGAAISIALAEAGPAVAINYRERTHEANKLAEDLRKAGVRVTTVQADVSPAEVVSKMVDSAKSELGTIGILINAGIAITRGIDDLSENDFDRIRGRGWHPNRPRRSSTMTRGRPQAATPP